MQEVVLETEERGPALAAEAGPSRRAVRRAIRLCLLASDVVMLLAAGLLATLLRFSYLTAVARFERVEGTITYFELSFVFLGVWLACFWAERLYDMDRVFWGSGEFSRLVRAASIGVVGFILVTFVLKIPGLSRLWTIIAWAMAIVLASTGRLIVRALVGFLRRRGHLLRPTLIVGANGEAEDLLRVLSADPATGMRPVGCLASSRAERLALNFCAGVPCLGAAREVVQVVRDNGIHTVVVASSAFDHDIVARMMSELRSLDVDVHLSSGLFEVLTSRVLVREISGVPLLTVKGVSLSRANLLTKRAFDLAVAGVIVLAGLPLWLTLALLVKVTSPGPVLYGQRRLGRDGVPFLMLKFRSMVDGAEGMREELLGDGEDGRIFKMKDDPRVTAVGKWMRKFSLDEFPQLINVIRGEMSLVGPRPPLPSEVDRYTESDWRRLEVVPGMTGLWQVSGRSGLTFEEMVRLDLFYIENWSVRLDLALLARTVPAVLAARGAY